MSKRFVSSRCSSLDRWENRLIGRVESFGRSRISVSDLVSVFFFVFFLYYRKKLKNATSVLIMQIVSRSFVHHLLGT